MKIKDVDSVDEKTWWKTNDTNYDDFKPSSKTSMKIEEVKEEASPSEDLKQKKDMKQEEEEKRANNLLLIVEKKKEEAYLQYKKGMYEDAIKMYT